MENSDKTLQSRLAQARGLREANQLEPAATAYLQVLQLQPLQTEALKFLLDRALNTGDIIAGLLYSESLLSVYPADVKLHNLIGDLLQRLVEREDAQAALHRLIKQCPSAYSCRLILARLQDVAGQKQQATKHYLNALKTANAAGFWLNDASTAPWARPFVMHAQHFVEQQRQQLARVWLEPLWQSYGKHAMQRVTKSVLMYSGEIPLQIADTRQKPNFLYIPDLPATPVFERNMLPFSDEYEAAWPAIKQEMLTALENRNQFKPFAQHSDEELTAGGDWDAYFFYRHGTRFAGHHSQCPLTSQALAKLPLVHIAGHAPETCFSLMTAGAHILPHRGVTNSRAVLHLGLTIPQNCRLNLCGVKEMAWGEGQTFAFDDTYLHEAWNKGSADRVILLTDIWNPYLTSEEQLAIQQIVENIGVFNSNMTEDITV